MLAIKFLLLLLVAANAPKVMPCKSFDNDGVLEEIQEELGKMNQEEVFIVSEMAQEASHASILKNNNDTNIKLEKSSEMLVKVEEQGLTNAADIKNLKECQKFLYLQGQVRITGSQFFSTNQRIFHFNKTQMEWYDAEKYCQQKGMLLATLKTLEELDYVTEEIENHGFNFWLSASDIGRTPGQFYWVDGTMVDKSVWYPGEPNQFTEQAETCVYMDTRISKLEDASCTGQCLVLCEVVASCV